MSAPLTASAVDYYLSCHCQANLLKLLIPLSQSYPTSATSSTVRPAQDATETDDHGEWETVSPPEFRSNTNADPATNSANHPAEQDQTTDHTRLLASSSDVLVCDCSICIKRLIIWSIQPMERITFIRGCERGRGTLKGYEFGERVYGHHFCGTCGTQIFSSLNGSNDYLGLNLRAVREPRIDIYALFPRQENSATKPPSYLHPSLPNQTMEYLAKRQRKYEYETEVYTASCHCQAVVFGVVGRKMDEEEPFACMCSICAGNGNIWLRIGMHDLAFARLSSSPSLIYKPDHNLVTFYRFGASRVNHVFCNTCGCQLYETIEGGDGDETFEGKREERTDEMWTKVNVAAFSGMEKRLGDGMGKTWGGRGVEVKREMVDKEPKYKIRV